MESNKNQATEYSQQQILDISQQLATNRQKMLEILQKSPKVGVYQNQSRQEWQGFFKFYKHFLLSEFGPREQCAKVIRQRLLAEEQVVSKLLYPFNLRPQMHIREIYMKIKGYKPCPEYKEMKQAEAEFLRSKENIKQFDDKSSPMVQVISQALLKTHGQNYNVIKYIDNMKLGFRSAIIEAEENFAKLRKTVEKYDGYHQLIAVQKYFASYFAEWEIADSQLSRQIFKNGKAFNQRVINKILPYISFLQKKCSNQGSSEKNLEVFQNLSWLPKSLGEIDIALGYKDKHYNRYLITTLISCKPRLFDLRQAYYQVSLEQQRGVDTGTTFQELNILKQENQTKKKEFEAKFLEQDQMQCKEIEAKTDYKKFLKTEYGPAELVENHHFFVITTLPLVQFVLPIESKLKESIQKHTQNMFLEDVKSEALYQCLKDTYSNTLSPLDWLKKHEAQQKRYPKILVLSDI